MAVASVLLALFMLVLSIVTVVGNLAVLLSYYLDKNIRQPTNYFIFSLAISDLLIGLEGIPVYTAFYLNNNQWIWGDVLCDLWLSIDYIVCLASIYTVLGITVDRYYSVKKPAVYRNWRTPRRVVLIIIFIWLVPSILFSVSIFGYGTFTGTGRILKENECYVQFMTNPYLNMGMYISYYWTTLFVMLYLYWGIYRAAKKLALKSDQKTKRLALLTEMRRPEVSVRTSDAGNSSSDSPNDTSNSSKCFRTAPPTSTLPTTQTTSGTPPPVFRNHMTLHNNNIDYTKENEVVRPPTPPDEKDNTYSNPNFSIISEQLTNGFSRQEPSSVIERESTAPCVSPEPSQASQEGMDLNEVNHHPHFKPELSLPFIDADSVSSMVGHDDLRRVMSIRLSRSASTCRGPQTPVVEVIENVEEVLIALDTDGGIQNNNNNNNNVVVEPVANGGGGAVEVVAEKKKSGIENGGTMHHVTIANDQQQPSTSTKESTMDHKEETPDNHDPNEVKEYKSRSENRARKALRTITFILGSFIILWTPFYVLATIYGFCEQCKASDSFNMLYTISYYLCYMNSPLNPFCYAMANQQFKKTLTRIFKGDFRRV
ncbi:CBN-GAR-2 protein [Caenorhabditis brenneri]|uniref:CBN-GAR-2 protein n=1 Tax=Caenorhabditis brenneri TaxID=135651 RepID=G0P3V0_CAEBE|nr:CBN-GAR-2 protein [Caenorhabditis brenneri]